MDTIKTDLFPSNLRAAKEKEGEKQKVEKEETEKGKEKEEVLTESSMTPAEPLPGIDSN